MVLGLMLTIGMTNVFSLCKQAYRLPGCTVVIIQENGRYAMEVLACATSGCPGYQGCGNLAAVVPNVLASSMPSSGTFSPISQIRGCEYDGSAFSATMAIPVFSDDPGYAFPDSPILAKTATTSLPSAAQSGSTPAAGT